MISPASLVRERAYPRFALAILLGVFVFPLSFLVVLLGALHPAFVFLAAALKYLAGSLVVVGAFFYALYWSVDYGPDYLRERRR